MTPDLTLDDCWNRIGVRGDRSCERLARLLHCRNCPVHEDATRLLMQRRIPDGYAHEWAEHHGEPVAAARIAGISLIVFRLGREWLALPTGFCMRIANLAPVHHLPHRSNDILSGVVNIDGKLTAQVSLANMLTIDAREPAVPTGRQVYPRLMLLQTGDHQVAVPVQELHGIIRCEAEEMQPVPATTNKATARYLTGVVSTGTQPVGCLDADLITYRILQVLQ